MSRIGRVVSDAVDSETCVGHDDRVSWQLLDNAMSLHRFAGVVGAVHGIDLRQDRTAALHLIGNHQLCHRPDRRAMLIGCRRVSFLQCFGRRKCDRRAIQDEHPSPVDYRLTDLAEVIADAVGEFQNGSQRQAFSGLCVSRRILRECVLSNAFVIGQQIVVVREYLGDHFAERLPATESL